MFLCKFKVEPLSDIFTRHAVGLYWVPGHAGIRGNEIADELTRGVSVLEFFMDPSRPWESLDGINEEGLDIGH